MTCLTLIVSYDGYGAGPETLILVTRAARKICPPAENPKTVVYAQRTKKKQRFGYPELRSKPQRWIPELRFGYLPLRNFSKPFWEKLRNFLKSLGWSGAPTRGLFLAKYSAETTKYIDVSQPPHQGEDAKRTLNGR